MLLLKLAMHKMILDGKQIKKMSPVTGLIYGKHDIEEEKTYSKGS